MFHRIVRKLFALLLLHDRFETPDQFLEVLDVQIGIEMNTSLVLDFLEDLLEGVDLGLGGRLEVEDDVAVHLDEAAIAIPGEAFIAGGVDEALEGLFVEADVEDGIHHAGHGHSGAGPAGDQEWAFGIAEFGPHDPLSPTEGILDFLLQFGGILSVIVVIIGADLGGDGEPSRHGQPDQAHLGEVGSFAAE